ncbi:hypothetical protein CXB51_031103 [Gossypium anomalum]|uniref:Aminotransferase-like plant mobile domain-containing protein n=1 Tax=Gossypium anomalum TaxID=47600 RepID=A0A8J5XVD0_9ROSI|nr:hypothetical protein CXB51_031103 [Gossypium anomalum]
MQTGGRPATGGTDGASASGGTAGATATGGTVIKERKERREKKEEKKKKEQPDVGEGKKKEKEKEKKRERRKKKEKKGIAMASLIKKDVPHICDTVNNMDSYRILRGRVNGLGYSLNALLMHYLELVGFGSAALTRTFDLRYDLISALFERWRAETHTFHLSCGECTVILEDVALHFGLPIDGDAVTGVSAIAKSAALCYSLLGASLGDADSTCSELKFTSLKANFQHLSANATEEELVRVARAYIMHIIGGVLMPNSNNNKVHLQYLPLLADLRNVRSYNRGSTVLAILYRELCRTTKPDTVDISGCLVLLQSWALYRMPFLASVSHQPYVFPLVNSRVVPRGSSTTIVWLHLVYPKFANAGGGDSRHQQERETWTALEGYALEIGCGVGESDGLKASDGYFFRFATIVRVQTIVL